MSNKEIPTQTTRDALRHKLLADLFELPVWERGKDRVVTPPWHALTVAERDLIAEALKQYLLPEPQVSAALAKARQV